MTPKEAANAILKMGEYHSTHPAMVREIIQQVADYARREALEEAARYFDAADRFILQQYKGHVPNLNATVRDILRRMAEQIGKEGTDAAEGR